MPEKKSTVRKATEEQPVQPASKVVGQTAEPKQGEGKEVAPEAAAAAPAVTPTGGKSAAVRMMTRSIAGKKPAAARGESQRVADAAKPSQKPAAGGARRGPRRGASKGR
jgi:hypothetical protein